MFSLLCYKEKIAALNVVKPGINTDQSEWILGIETTTEIHQNRTVTNLRLLDTLRYGVKFRGKVNTRKIFVTGVDTRMKDIKEAKN